jgi:hypothetical protein
MTMAAWGRVTNRCPASCPSRCGRRRRDRAVRASIREALTVETVADGMKAALHSICAAGVVFAGHGINQAMFEYWDIDLLDLDDPLNREIRDRSP